MTDDTRGRRVEVAEQVIRDVHKELPDVWLGGRQRYVLVEAIEKALADAERRGMERAAKIAESKLGPLLSDFDDHWGPRIARAIRAQAQAGEEG